MVSRLPFFVLGVRFARGGFDFPFFAFGVVQVCGGFAKIEIPQNMRRQSEFKRYPKPPLFGEPPPAGSLDGERSPNEQHTFNPNDHATLKGAYYRMSRTYITAIGSPFGCSTGRFDRKWI